MHVPLLFADRRPVPAPAGFSSVLADDRGGAFHAVEHAIGLGYRKLGFIGGAQHINIGFDRFGGFQDALRKHGLPLNDGWIAHGGFGRDDGFNGFMRLHRAGSLPEFLFAVTQPVALGVYDAAKDAGVNIPGEIDIMSFGDSDVSRYMTPPLSCVSQPARELGAGAVEVLLEMMAAPDAPVERHLVLPTELRLRGTCVAPAGPRSAHTQG
jgi:DNA-binding LacI/PurR family transcriptional regulator